MPARNARSVVPLPPVNPLVEAYVRSARLAETLPLEEIQIRIVAAELRLQERSRARINAIPGQNLVMAREAYRRLLNLVSYELGGAR